MLRIIIIYKYCYIEVETWLPSIAQWNPEWYTSALEAFITTENVQDFIFYLFHFLVFVLPVLSFSE